MPLVLIAEDDEDIAVVLTRLLKRAGMTVLRAADGRSAFGLVVARRPDVVLTDLGMPVMDGWELLAAIRGHAEVQDTPVAVLSGHLQPGDPRSADAGACVALLKPCSNERLRATIEQLADRGPHRHDRSTRACLARQLHPV
jgi:CheY-like chemotaxis protein